MQQYQFGLLRSVNTTQPILHNLNQVKVIVGREKSCDICIQSPSVSNKHASIQFSQTSPNDKDARYFCVLTDLHSTNGTFINHKKIQYIPITLRNGDFLRFGYDPTIFVVEFGPKVVGVEQEQHSEQEYKDSTTIVKSQDVLAQLEERIMELEMNANEIKNFPEPQLLAVQSALLVKIQTMAKELKVKAQKLAEESDTPQVKPEPSNTIEVLEDLHCTLEQVLLCLDKLPTKQDPEKIKQLEVYARSLEKKLSELRVKQWDASETNVQSIETENLVNKIKQLELELDTKEQSIEGLKNQLDGAKYMYKRIKMLEMQNTDLKITNESLRRFLKSTTPQLTFENRLSEIHTDLDSPLRTYLEPIIITSESDSVTYLTKLLVEKEKTIEKLQTKMNQLSIPNSPKI